MLYTIINSGSILELAKLPTTNVSTLPKRERAPSVSAIMKSTWHVIDQRALVNDYPTFKLGEQSAIGLVWRKVNEAQQSASLPPFLFVIHGCLSARRINIHVNTCTAALNSPTRHVEAKNLKIHFLVHLVVIGLATNITYSYDD